MKSFALIASVLLLAGAASAQTPRLVSLGEVWVADGVRIVPLTIDQIEGVLAVDINIVLDNRQASVVDFQLTDLLPGFFAELQLEDTGTTPNLLFSVVVLNGDENGAPVASGRYVAKMAGVGLAREMGMTLLK